MFGSGGPLLDVVETLKEDSQYKDLQLTMSDLYPNTKEAARIKTRGDSSLTYLLDPVDATNIRGDYPGVRTMVCSLHHMRPEVARSILKNAQESGEAFCAFEVSDNQPPIFLWWLAIPFAFLITLFVTPLVRPLTWRQIVFTYVIPLIPLFIAWDGAVSNARTYTLNDLEELIEGMGSEDYEWEMGVLSGRGGGKVWLLGLPIHSARA